VDPLAALAAEPARAALLLDLDGVLAPIVERPEDARVPPETQAELARLGHAYGLLACITGRTSEIAREIVGVEGLRYVGQHGLELEPAAGEYADRIHAFADAAGWSDLELKPLTAAFHYRRADDRDAARLTLEGVATRAVAAGFRALDGLELAVRVAIASSEGPSELGELADLVVGSSEAFLEILKRL
jgi:trehalose-phosphatase